MPSRGILPGILAVIVIVIVIVAGASTPAAAQETTVALFGDISVECTQLFQPGDGQVWSPLRVVVRNGSPHPRRLDLILGSSSEWTARNSIAVPVQLAAGSEKRLVVPIYIAPSGYTPFDVTVTEEGRRLPRSDGGPQGIFLLHRRGSGGTFGRRSAQAIIVRQGNRGTRAGPGWLPANTVNVLAVAPSIPGSAAPPPDWRQSLQSALEGSDELGVRDFVFRTLRADEMPVAPEAYVPVDRVVLLGVEPGDLGAAQVRALRRAIRGGMRAWIVPGRGGEGLGWVLSEELRRSPPVVLIAGGEERTVFLPAGDPGEGIGEPAAVAGSGAPIPLVLRYPEGLGEWRRLTTWGGESRFEDVLEESWARSLSGEVLAAEGSPMALAGMIGSRWQTAKKAWYSHLDRALRKQVSPELIFIYVIVYLMVAGPGLFLFLRKMGKLAWLLWLQPALVLLFLAATWLVGWATFGLLDESHETLVLFQGSEDGSAYGLSVLSRYTGIAGSRDLEAADGSLPIVLPAYKDVPASQSWRLDGDRGLLKDFPFATWSLSHFYTAGPLEIGGGLRAEIITVGGKRALVRVTNGLPFPLREVTFLGWGANQHAGTLAPGESREFHRGSGASVRPRDEVAAWTQMRGELWKRSASTGWRVRIIAEFDPASLPQEAPFAISEEKDVRRGILVGLEKRG
ncbi:MAG: hypothetical protein ACE5GW_04100 [Planctomycetota bacterium]